MSLPGPFRAPDPNNPRSLLGQTFQNSQTGACYIIIEEAGCFYCLYADGTRMRWGATQPQLTASPQGQSRSSRSDTVRRTVFSSSAPPDAHDPDSTPRPAHAFPASLEVGLNHPNHGANPQYWNYQFHTDGDGVASRTAEGPRDLITDPALTDRDIYAHKKLFATPGTREPLDPGYKRRTDPGHFFRIGKVFMMLWPEPAGNVGPGQISEVTQGLYNQPIFSKIRRFVVVREGNQCCTAVPILTYGGQGTSKRDVIKAEHAIIFTASRGQPPPSPLRSELSQFRGQTEMRDSIRVDAFAHGDTLAAESRVNLGKVYTVENYVKVKGFGMCTAPEILEAQFNDVWNQKRGSRTQPIPTRQPARQVTAAHLPSASTDRPSFPSRAPSDSRRQPYNPTATDFHPVASASAYPSSSLTPSSGFARGPSSYPRRSLAPGEHAALRTTGPSRAVTGRGQSLSSRDTNQSGYASRLVDVEDENSEDEDSEDERPSQPYRFG